VGWWIRNLQSGASHLLQQSRLLAAVALLAVIMLSGRPIAARLLDVHPDPQHMNIVGLPSGHHTCDVAPCEKMTPATHGMDFEPELITIVLAGLVVVVLSGTRPSLLTFTPSAISPPPKPVII
jgi:hypothetical protein